MSQQIINTGTEPGAGDGDDLYTAFDKVNQNFTEIYSGNVLAANIVVYSVAGRTGNVELTVQDILGAASTGNITAIQTQMAANSAADRAYTDATVASLSTVTDLNITGGTLSNVHITGHSYGNMANLSVTGSVTASGAVTANGISSTNNIVAVNDIALGGVLRFADNTTMSTATAPVDLTSTNAAIVTNTNRVAAANVEIAALRANITAANAAIVVLQSNAAAQETSINGLLSNAATQHVTLVSLQSNAATQGAQIDSLRSNITAANTAITTLQSNAATQATQLDTLDANLGALTTTVAGLGNIAQTNANVAAANTAISSTNANVTAANAAISALQSNAAAQAVSLNTINANVTAANASIVVLQSNAATQAAALSSLNANAITQESKIISINANVAAANLAISNLQANAATINALTANAAAQAVAIDLINANVTAANATIATLQSNAAAQSASLDTLTANAAAQHSAIAAKAPIASPTFTGTVSAPVLAVSGNATVGNISTTKLTAQQIQGNLVNIPSISATGNISSGNVSATKGTFDEIEGTLLTAAQPNVTTLGTLDQLDVDGNVTADRVITNEIRGTLFAGPQPGITTVGTLASLTVTGNIVTEGNTVRANAVQANAINSTGNVAIGGNLAVTGCLTVLGSTLTLSPGITINAGAANVTAVITNSANIQSTLVGNVGTFVGNLTAANITANGTLAATNIVANTMIALATVQAGNISATNLTGTLQTAAQPNVTSLGTLSGLTVSGPVNVTGNAIISDNLYVTGNLFIAGNSTTVNSEDVTTAELTITLANGAPTSAATNGAGIFVDTANAAITYDYTSDSWVLNKNAVIGNITTANIAAGNINASTLYGTVATAAQPNITSVGTLSSLSVTGNVASGNLITARADVTSVRFGDNTVQTTAANTAIEAYLVVVNANVTAANTEINGLRANVAAANVEIGNLRANVTAANVEVDSLRANVTAANTEINGLRANVTAANVEIGSLQANIASANVEIGSLQANIASANVEVDGLRANVTAANVEVDGLRANVTAANVEIGNLQSNVIAANTEINGLRANVTAANAQIALKANTASPTFTGNLVADIIFTTSNVTVGNITGNKAEFIELSVLSSGLVTGNLVAGNLTASGTVSTDSLVAAGNVSAGNISVGKVTAQEFEGSLINAPSASVIGNLTAGNLSTTGSLTANSVSTTGNIVSQQSVVGSSAQFTSVYGQIETPNQPQINVVGTLIDLNISGNINTVDWVLASGGAVFTEVTGILKTNAQPYITSVGTLIDLSVTGNVGTGNVSGATAVFSEVVGTVLTNAQPYITSVGTLIDLSVTGNVSSANLVVGNIAATDNISTSGNVYANNLILSGSFGLTGNTSFANVIAGNISASGNITSSQNIIAVGNIASGNLTVSGTISAAGISITGGAGTIDLGTGTLTAGQLIGNLLATNVQITSTAESTSTGTGALIVVGGAGIGANTNIGGNLTVAANARIATNLVVAGDLTSGNANIGTPDGTNFVFGVTNFKGSTLETDNSAIALFTTTVNQIEFGLAAQDIEIGALLGNTVINHDLIVSGNIYGNIGNSSPISNTFVHGNLTISNFAIANNAIVSNANVTNRLSVDNTFASLNSQSGALVVAGGIGVVKNISVGLPNLPNSNVIVYGTTQSTNTTTGALQVRGGAGIGGNLTLGGFANVSNTSPAISTTTGALRVAGGAGIGGNLYVGGNVNVVGDFTVTGTVTLPTIAIASLNDTPIGNAIPSSGVFTTLGFDENSMRPRSKPSLNLDFANGRKLDGRFTYTGSAAGTYVNSAGALVDSESSSIPRFHHNPSGECLGVLIEEQRTNLLLGSEQFEQANASTYWTTLNSYVTPGTTTGAIGPRGTTSGVSQLKEDSSTGIHGVAVHSGSVATLTLSATYTASVMAKKGTRDQIAIIFEGEGTPTVFDLTFGNITSEGTSYRSSIESYANNWYRCFSTVTKTNTSGNVTIAMASGGSASYTGDDASTMDIFGAQLELGTFGTSYIKTTTGSVTRSADNLTISSSYTNTYFSQQKATLFVDGTVNYRPTDLVSQNTRGVFMSLEDGTADNRIQILAETKSSPVPFRSANLVGISSGVIQANIGEQGNLFSTTSGRISAFFNANVFAFSFNANSAITDVSGNVATLTQLKVGSGTGGNYLNGCVSKIQLYPTVVTTSELEILTRQ